MARGRRPGVHVTEFQAIEDTDDQGTYETWWGTAKVHVKIDDVTKPYMLVNEFIGARLAAALGLPTLPGEVASAPDGSGRCWVTPQVTIGKGATPPPARAQDVAENQPNLTAAMIAFDTWIHNQDRSADNVLFDPAIGLWLIDHENSLALPDGQAFQIAVRTAAEQPLSWHGFADEPIEEEALEFWCQRVHLLSRGAIEQPVNEAYARGLITKNQEAWIIQYLLIRKTQVKKLLPPLKDVQRAAPPDPEDLLLLTSNEE